MHRKRVHPALIAHRVKTARNRAPRRVHKNIETTEVLYDLFDTIPAGFRVCNIGFHKSRCHPMSLNSREKIVRQRNRLSRNHGNVSTLTCQVESSGSPDTTGTPSD
jgi:hypothetical protein